MGVQASGKGTHGKAIADRYGMVHISTGDLLRRHIANGTQIGKEYQEEYAKGNLASDNILFRIIRDEMIKVTPSQQGFILDGFPRTIKQLEWFEKHEYEFDSIVINLEISRHEAIQRMKLRSRVDDNDEAINQRLNDFYKNTHPIISYYETQGNSYTINGEQSIQSTFADIQKELENFAFFRERSYDTDNINF